MSVAATLALVACSPPDDDSTRTGRTGASGEGAEQATDGTSRTSMGADSAAALGRCPVLEPGSTGACVELVQDLLVKAGGADATAFTAGTFEVVDAVLKALLEVGDGDCLSLKLTRASGVRP